MLERRKRRRGTAGKGEEWCHDHFFFLTSYSSSCSGFLFLLSTRPATKHKSHMMQGAAIPTQIIPLFHGPHVTLKVLIFSPLPAAALIARKPFTTVTNRKWKSKPRCVAIDHNGGSQSFGPRTEDTRCMLCCRVHDENPKTNVQNNSISTNN